jgi:hypothetical protein
MLFSPEEDCRQDSGGEKNGRRQPEKINFQGVTDCYFFDSGEDASGDKERARQAAPDTDPRQRCH